MNAFKFGTTLILASVVALPAMAEDAYYDTARVVSVTPQVERINNPRQECHTETIRESWDSGERDIGGAIIGGIAGGLIGSQIGKGNGKVAGAAVGAVTGALVGDRIDNSGRSSGVYRSRPVERCSSVDNWQTVTRNYLVTYRYNGRDYTTTMPRDPGATLRVQVSVMPDYGNHEVISYLPGYARDSDLRIGWDRDDRGHGRGHGHERGRWGH